MKIETNYGLTPLMIAIITGCASVPRPLALWKSDQTNLPEKAHAAEQLIQPGWNRNQVEATLGQGNWVHRHGPSIVMTDPNLDKPSAATQDFEDWSLEYPGRDGCVAVMFTNSNPITVNEPRFRSSGVTYRRALKFLPQYRDRVRP